MKDERISALLSQRIEAGDFPSAVYLIAEKGKIKFADALGFAVKSPTEIPVRFDTIYDLASLTKPLVTGLLIAKLIEKNDVALKDKISDLLSEFESVDKGEITVQSLLSHTSGFPAWKPFYLLTKSEKFNLDLIASEQLVNTPKTKVVYSDLNFITLGFLLENFYEKDLLNISTTEIFSKLGLTRTFWGELESLRGEIAASEFGNNYEKQVCQEGGFDVENFTWRNYQIWGQVHDGNAWYLGGAFGHSYFEYASGHAGLFSSAEEVFKIALQFLPSSTTLLKPETCDLFKTNFTRNLNEARSFAFELAATANSTASTSLAKNSFGHLGFTGTSLWIEPDSERIFILLTNRTHRPLPFVNINATRRRFHELATESLNSI